MVLNFKNCVICHLKKTHLKHNNDQEVKIKRWAKICHVNTTAQITKVAREYYENIYDYTFVNSQQIDMFLEKYLSKTDLRTNRKPQESITMTNRTHQGQVFL